jgi:hypothetical protein
MEKVTTPDTQRTIVTAATVPPAGTDPWTSGRPSADPDTSLDDKQARLRDLVRAVADAGLLGLYVFGRPGTGKSFLTQDELELRETRYIHSAGHITAKGLFQLLRAHPSDLHVLDDVESVFRYPQAVEILRAALASQNRIVHGRDYRVIKWASWNRLTPDQFLFTGRIIALGNIPFPDGPAQDALRSRLAYLHFDITHEEIIQMIRKLAQRGHRSRLGLLGPDECCEVAEFVIGADGGGIVRRSAEES